MGKQRTSSKGKSTERVEAAGRHRVALKRAPEKVPGNARVERSGRHSHGLPAAKAPAPEQSGLICLCRGVDVHSHCIWEAGIFCRCSIVKPAPLTNCRRSAVAKFHDVLFGFQRDHNGLGPKPLTPDLVY